MSSRPAGRPSRVRWIQSPGKVKGTAPPVLIAAGGEDERAPIVHSKKMEKALRQAGVKVETRYYDTEGHGFYTLPHRQEYYAQLLAFLGRNLQPETAPGSSP